MLEAESAFMASGPCSTIIFSIMVKVLDSFWTKRSPFLAM